MYLNQGQQAVHDMALANLRQRRNQVFQYSGQAGSGKSYTLYQICLDSGIPMNKILPMAFTGAAAAVLRKKGFPTATTLHSGLFIAEDMPNPLFYERRKEMRMNEQFGVPDVPPIITKFVPRKELPGIELIVIDEGYMCPKYMRSVIESFGIPIIVTGDRRQLNPVGDDPAYLTDPNVPELTELVRQDANSPIIYLARRILEGLPINTGIYGNRVLVIEDNDLNDNMIRSSDLVLCGTNATRDYWNSHARRDIYGYDTKLPNYGERVICRHNNHGLEQDGIELANGLIGYTVSSPDVSGFNGKNFFMDFLPDMMSRPFRNLQCDYEYFSAPTKVRANYHNPYNTGERFEFAYSITTHLSQGSEANRGIYIDEYMGRGSDMQTRLAYTGVTRFKESLIFVKPHRRFY
jgi:exodeoxyribonuclease-5